MTNKELGTINKFAHTQICTKQLIVAAILKYSAMVERNRTLQIFQIFILFSCRCIFIWIDKGTSGV